MPLSLCSFAGTRGDVDLRIESGFFGADAAALLKRFRRIETAVDCVLLIAHNPGFEDLAAGIRGGGPEPMRRRMSEKFPTAALAAFTIDPARWSSLREGAAVLTDFVLLKDLAQVRRKPREARQRFQTGSLRYKRSIPSRF